MANHPPWWDPYSSQPYKLTKQEKPRVSWSNILEYSRVGLSACLLAPLLAWHYFSLKKTQRSTIQELAGLSINADPQWHSSHLEMVEELGVRNLLIRIPAWETDRLDEYTRFMERFPHHHFLVNILQSRDSVADPELWRQQVLAIFEQLSPVTDTFQIGNAINRSKWGCRHSADALDLFRIADQERQKIPGVKLLGSSVIDFEPLITMRTLFNFSGYRMDGCAAELYVNRRGSAYGRQYGVFDLEKKIRLIKAILSASNNTRNQLWITETNWPLLDTRPYTPNSGHPRSTVDEKTQAEYLKQYYKIALECGWVERVYWWQLINPGYGLVDHRGNTLRKMPAYYAFKELLDNSN